MSVPVIRLPRRQADMLKLLQARAEGGVVEAMTADLARALGLQTAGASCILTALAQSGLIEQLVRASRSRPGRWRIPAEPVIEANRPRGPEPSAPAAKAARPRGVTAGAAAAPLLFDWIAARLDDDGTIEMGTHAMAAGVGVGVSTVEHLLARWKAIGAVRVLRRGGPFAVSRWRFDVGLRDLAAGCTAVHPNKRGAMRTAGASRGQALGAEPPLRAPAAPRTRCPFCEMPPGHALCRHGWNGTTTRGQRRMIAEGAGVVRAGVRR